MYSIFFMKKRKWLERRNKRTGSLEVFSFWRWRTAWLHYTHKQRETDASSLVLLYYLLLLLCINLGTIWYCIFLLLLFCVFSFFPISRTMGWTFILSLLLSYYTRRRSFSFCVVVVSVVDECNKSPVSGSAFLFFLTCFIISTRQGPVLTSSENKFKFTFGFFVRIYFQLNRIVNVVILFWSSWEMCFDCVRPQVKCEYQKKKKTVFILFYSEIEIIQFISFSFSYFT